MKKLIFTITLLFIVGLATTQSSYAFDRDALIAEARAGVGITNAYNINTVVINTAGSQIIGAPLPANSLQTLSDVLAKIQVLKNRLRSLH